MNLSFLRVGIRAKILTAVAATLVTGIASVLWISTRLQLNDSRQFMLKASADQASAAGSQFALELRQVMTRARSWVVQSLAQPAEVREAELVKLLEGDPSVASLAVFDLETARAELQATQSKEVERATAFVSAPTTPVAATELRHESVTVGGVPYHRFTVPLQAEGEVVKKLLVVHVEAAAIKGIFNSDGLSQVFLFDGSGRVLARADYAGATGGLEIREQVPADLLRQAVGSPVANVQLAIHAPEGGYIGSAHKTGVGQDYVGVLVDEERIFETPRRIAVRSLYLGLAILSLALVVAVFFADSLVQPVLKLVDSANAIRRGDFEVRTRVRTRDELETLAKAFNEMAAGLAEREKLKSVFSKFHSKAVVDKLMGEDKLRLGGEKLPVTVFFSDIRSFTSSSETMAPEEVVEMLNEYMTEMVAVIERFGGVVDKYVGDAIMAVWGMPQPDPSVDATNALLACLEMRVKLDELNVRRAARGQPPLKIGMGLNSGEVIAGNIGSQSRMEYTVIGDTVNTASRMESLTKEFHTDLLVNESTQSLVDASQFRFEGPWEATAKGKADKVLVYGCQPAGAASDPSASGEPEETLKLAA
jgi:adenylate cyclase